MRALFTTQPGSGHWRVLAPFARELAHSGVEVRFATAPWYRQWIVAEGFDCVAVGSERHWAEATASNSQRESSEAPGQSATVWTEVFVKRRAADTLPDLLRLCESWQPDVIVRDLTEFGGYLAGELLEIPHAAVQVGAYRPALQRLIAPELNRLRRALGLAPDPDLASLYRYLLISPVPPAFHSAPQALPPTTYHVQFEPFDEVRGVELPVWIDQLGDRPTIYATLGSAYNDSVATFEAIRDAFVDVDVNLIMTIGDKDPMLLGNVPDHIRIERYIPQSRIFPYCDAVICHGGFSTVLTAIRFGLPMVIMPIAADQPDNALRCEQLGIAKVLMPEERKPATIHGAAWSILRTESFRNNAEALQLKMRSQPGKAACARRMMEILCDPR